VLTRPTSKNQVVRQSKKIKTKKKEAIKDMGSKKLGL